MRRFSLYLRGKVFYVKFWNEEIQNYDHGISTGKRSRNEALMKVNEWLRYGFTGRDEVKTTVQDRLHFQTILYYLSTMELDEKQKDRLVDVLVDQGIVHENSTLVGEEEKESKLLIPFLGEFWDYENSPYVREKHAYGQSIGKRHCYEQTKRLSHWKKFFDPDTRLADVTKEDLRNFQLALKDKDLAPKTINMILTVGTVPFGWAAEREEIAANPAEGLRKFSGASKKRDILSLDEIQKIFSISWDDERARVGNLLAMTTGLRAGEVIALRNSDIQGDKLMVRHSWSFADGLKAPKNGDERVVPLIPQIKKELLKLLDTSPYGSRGFIFYGTKPDKPMNIDVLSKGLTKAYITMNLPASKKNRSKETEAIRKAMVDRGICFHSWRHFYATHLADKIELRTVQLATGHKTSAMAAHYADHAQGTHLEQVSKAVNDVFVEMIKPVKMIISH
jgi:integrase